VPEQVVEPRARLAYVLGQFPSVSETFILREMRAVQNLGFDITPLSMEAGAEPVHRSARALAERTVYRPSPLSWPALASLFAAFLLKPFGCVSALRLVLSHGLRNPGASKELLSAYSAACYFVASIPPGQMRHIHAHFATYPATVGLLLAEILGVGFSMSCHARDIFTDTAKLLALKISEAEFVTVCTEYGAERLQRKYSPLNSEKLHVIRHGLDFADFRVGPHQDHHVPLIVSVGRLVEKKGFPILLRAAAMLAAEGIDFELAIVGEGPQREELEQLINGLALAKRVHLPGYLPEQELMAVYRRADVFALTPIVAADGDRDGLPNAIIEAMAAGIPVVASDVGAVGELVIHEETGLLAQPGDVAEIARYLERALIDQPLREHIAASALRRVERDYDVNRNSRELGALFAEILKLRQWPPAASSRGTMPSRRHGDVELE